MADIFLVVGLGNPGARYERTRHNIGFWAVDRLASRHNLTFSKQEHRALTASGIIQQQRVILAKPQTFMNLSGDSVAPLARFYKIPAERIIVVHDDLDLPLGTLRIRKTGSSGGQNGLKHIIERLGTQDIARIRIGIGRPPGRMDPAAYVLTAFQGDDEILATEMADKAGQAVETWLASGIEIAMNRHNTSGGTKTARASEDASSASESAPPLP